MEQANRRTLADFAKWVVSFRDARDWGQFHNPKDTAISLSLEAAEVLELYQWKGEDQMPATANLARELSDVLYWTLLMAHDAGIDLASAFHEKMLENEKKYPVERAKGSAAKYTEL